MNLRRPSSSRLSQQGYDRAHTWRVRKSRWYFPILGFTFLGAFAEVFLIVMAVARLVGETPFHAPFRWIEDQCTKDHNFACGLLQSIVMPFLTLALATVAYLSFRFTRVSRAYLRKARETPRDMVQTAGGIFGRVVGRDQLCEVLMEDLRDSRFRRTHVVVGGIGTGKTALLVLLTRQLARQGAVPVPLRLRGVEGELDFRQLAFDRFKLEVQGHLRSGDEAEKVWRRLNQQGRIVVLADGLEDALAGDGLTEERDTLIRLAVRRANEERMPLVIASRPHDALRGLDASLTDLEPLNEEAALAYISSGTPWEDRQRLDWIVEKAGIAEAPTYLQVARELHEEGLLERALTGRSQEGVETRGGDRAALRLHLVDTWMNALVTGQLCPHLPLGRDDRRTTLEYLSALACAGLAADSAEVRIGDVVNERDPAQSRFPEIVTELARRVQGSRLDIRLAAHWGAGMGLVELGGERVRFQHSVIQAHLGARFMNAVIRPETPGEPTANRYFPAALENPGRELLIAMILHSRTPEGSCTHGRAHGNRTAWCPVSVARDLVLGAACRAQQNAPPADQAQRDDAAHPDRARAHRGPGPAQQPGGRRAGEVPHDPADPRQVFRRTLHTKAVQLYAAALQIDSVDRASQQHRIAMELTTAWPDFQARDPHSLGVAKELLVSRFGEALRSIDRRHGMHPAYAELLQIGCLESSYGVRVAIAHEIGAGGDSAFELLQARLLAPRTEPERPMERRPEWLLDMWESQQPRAVPAGEDTARPQAPVGLAPLRRLEDEEREEEEREWRHDTLCAWLIPLLVGSVTVRRHHATPYEILAGWVERVGARNGSGVKPLDLTLEIALAQGFKYAANRRARHPHARPQAREYLIEQAWDMLKRSRFWFTRLTLLHALTLWELPDGGSAAGRPADRGSDPAEQVRQWLALRDGTPQHPFVEAAAELCVWALQTRQPERFLWIDECGVSAQVGSQSAGEEVRKHQLWIPPSTGWSTLHPRAQQLLADVLLLLNLADRGDWPKDRLQRLHRTDRPDLPPCLTKDRRPLDPDGGLVRTAAARAGSNCRDDCAFELCPYPPPGPGGHRPALSEAFCRAQFTVLSRSRSLLHPEAPWQRHTDLAELRLFWERMSKRSRSGRPG
ncbi:ATP-binding protein [Streptomyces sp. NPDC005574]|uniref:ATP-binding protein n=1 Tax=Streptomyces sp. NPDC005574 TaxID=3156891 RepID=UPI0033ABBF39